MSKSTQPAAAKPRKKPFFTNDDLWGYAFIGVAVIFFLMFTIYPLISAVITSLEDYKPFGSDFVGLKNYQTTFTNALFWKSLNGTPVRALLHHAGPSRLLRRRRPSLLHN